MTKVLIVGDTHDDASFVANIHKVARLEQVDTIIQLGDFGFGFSDNMLASIAAWLDRDENHEWYWIDGNHDEHNYIEQEIIGDRYVGPPHRSLPRAHVLLPPWLYQDDR